VVGGIGGYDDRYGLTFVCGIDSVGATCWLSWIGGTSSNLTDSFDSSVKTASFIRLTLTGNSLERVSVFMGLVNTILAITSFIVGSSG
jgi:hypothetical protein